MDLGSIKNSFAMYLLDLKDKTNSSKYNNVKMENANIFQFSSEFKDFISEEYNTTNSIQSMSISEILDMELDESGRLVTPEELAEMEQATKDALNGITSNEGENAEETTPAETDGNTTADTAGATGETGAEGAATEGVATEGAAAEVPAQPLPDTTEAEGLLGEATDKVTNIVTELIGEMVQNEDFIKAFDGDGNLGINKEELESFINLANNFDGDLENLSINDLLQGMDAILKGEDLSKVIEGLTGAEDAEATEETAETEDAAEETPTEEANKTEETAPVPTSSPISGSSPVGGSSGGGNVGGTSGSSNNTPVEKTLETMTEEELKAELQTAEGDLSTKENELNAIQDGTNSELKALEENIDKAYEEYQEQLKLVDEELAEKVDSLKEDIDKKDEEIGENEKAITTKEGEVADAETAYEGAQSHTQKLESRLSELKTKLSSADEDSKAKISEKISALEAEIETAKAAEQKAKDALDTKKAELQKLKDKDTQLNTEKSELEKQMTELETKIQKEYPEVAEYMKKYQEAEKAYDTKEQELKTEAQKGVTDAQAKVDEINTAINELRTKKTLQKYGIGEYDEEAGKTLANAADKSRWDKANAEYICATGVADIFNDVYKTNYGGHGYQWADNMEDMVQKGKFKEVTDQYTSSDQLASLPAGAIVTWDATGNGTEGGTYGHVAISMGDGTEISDHRASMTRSVGGRSDNYRVFIPVS